MSDTDNLNNLINNNSIDRESNDNIVIENINIEAKNREDNDLKLNNNLNIIINERKNNDLILKSKITELKDRLKKLESRDESSIKLKNGFIINELGKWYNVESKERFEVIGITRSLPPTKIMIKYNKCEIFYNIIRDLKGFTSCYFYNGYYYYPENRRMLRYSPSGIVTLDYIVCRVTIIGEASKKNLLLKIEK